MIDDRQKDTDEWERENEREVWEEKKEEKTDRERSIDRKIKKNEHEIIHSVSLTKYIIKSCTRIVIRVPKREKKS